MLLLIKSIKICSSIEYIVCIIIYQLECISRETVFADTVKYGLFGLLRM